MTLWGIRIPRSCLPTADILLMYDVFKVTELCDSAVTVPRMVQPGFGCFYRWRLNHCPGQPGPVLSHLPLQWKRGSWSSDSLPGFSLHMLSLLPSQNFTEKIFTLSSSEVHCLLLTSSHPSYHWWPFGPECSASSEPNLLSAHLAYSSVSIRRSYGIQCQNALLTGWQHLLFSLLTANLFSLLEKVIMLVKYDFPFVNPYWLLPVSFLFSMCLKSISSINCSMTLPRTGMRLNSL